MWEHDRLGPIHGEVLELVSIYKCLLLICGRVVHLSDNTMGFSKNASAVVVLFTHHEVVVWHIYAVTHDHSWQALVVSRINAHMYRYELDFRHGMRMHK